MEKNTSIFIDNVGFSIRRLDKAKTNFNNKSDIDEACDLEDLIAILFRRIESLEAQVGKLRR